MRLLHRFILKIKRNRMYLKDIGEFYQGHHRGRWQQTGLSSSFTESVSEVGPCYLRIYANQILLAWLTPISSLACNATSAGSSSRNPQWLGCSPGDSPSLYTMVWIYDSLLEHLQTPPDSFEARILNAIWFFLSTVPA